MLHEEHLVKSVVVSPQLLLSDFPSTEGKLGLFRRNLRASGQQRWEENWDQTVLPILTADNR